MMRNKEKNNNETDFDVIPAIDILGGKCVRLTQGDYDQVEEFSTDPIEVAKKWEEKGAKRLHLVDLDGAKDGTTTNKEIIKKIVQSTNIDIQVGGGIRSVESIKQYLDFGVRFIILGTKAFKDKDFLDSAIDKFGKSIIVGLDMKKNKVALSGWTEVIETDFNKLADYLKYVDQIIFTDISKDGTLSGPNLTSVEELAKIIDSKIIVSGGLSTLDDIILILDKRKIYKNISGVILGKSLYKKTIDLEKAISISKTT